MKIEKHYVAMHGDEYLITKGGLTPHVEQAARFETAEGAMFFAKSRGVDASAVDARTLRSKAKGVKTRGKMG